MSDPISPRRGNQADQSSATAEKSAARQTLRVRAGYLGKTTNKSAILAQQGFQGSANKRDPAEDRFRLQHAAARLLPNFRVAKCLWWRNANGHVSLIQTDRGWKYGGLQTCGSVWHCPVCAAKISERRRFEVMRAIARHAQNGGQTYHLTLTMPHTASEMLSFCRKRFMKAQNLLHEMRGYKNLKTEISQIGYIRALEVTHGRTNGWHVHAHVLMLAAKDIDVAAIERRLFQLWQAACIKAGATAPTREHGVKFQGGSSAAGYITKWGMELTKAHSKHGTGASRTPFDILRDVDRNPDDLASAKLFREYASAMHGSMQLRWSDGLKDLFGINELDDEALANEADATEMDRVNIDQYWHAIKKADARATVLRIARDHGKDEVLRWLQALEVQEINPRRPDDNAD